MGLKKFNLKKWYKEDFNHYGNSNCNRVCSGCQKITIDGKDELYFAKFTQKSKTNWDFSICKTCYNSLQDKKPFNWKSLVGKKLGEVEKMREEICKNDLIIFFNWYGCRISKLVCVMSKGNILPNEIFNKKIIKFIGANKENVIFEIENDKFLEEKNEN